MQFSMAGMSFSKESVFVHKLKTERGCEWVKKNLTASDLS